MGFGFVGLVLPPVLVALGVAGWRVYSRRERPVLHQVQDYQWYRHCYPHEYHHNKIHCHQCGGRHLHLRGLGQLGPYQEHFCGDCGATLFYSPQGV